jgi:hypothetical protein
MIETSQQIQPYLTGEYSTAGSRGAVVIHPVALAIPMAHGPSSASGFNGEEWQSCPATRRCLGCRGISPAGFRDLASTQ